MQFITSVKNPIVKEMKSLNQKNKRRQAGYFLIEGEKMLGEALSSGCTIGTVLISEQKPLSPALEQQLKDQGAHLFAVSDHVLQTVCDTETPQGSVASCSFRPEPAQWGSRCIYLDGLQDPGNMGTILRTADAMGIDLVIAAGCVDVYNPKVVRSTMGSLFRQQVLVTDQGTEILQQMRKDGWRVLSSVLDAAAQPLPQADLTGKVCIVIGNEGRGVSQQVLACSDGTVYIPMRGGAESLNAGIAAGIFMWELACSAANEKGERK